MTGKGVFRVRGETAFEFFGENLNLSSIQEGYETAPLGASSS